MMSIKPLEDSWPQSPLVKGLVGAAVTNIMIAVAGFSHLDT